jgi:hypothetical protein
MLRVLGSSYQARAHNIKYGYDVREFLEFFRLLLQRMVDEIWAGIRWVERHNGRGGRRLMRAPRTQEGSNANEL